MINKKIEKSGPRSNSSDEIAQMFDFVAPTEFVELPSKGQFYPQGHPLHNQEVIEIKYMTAKHEDILTNRSLLKKGLALNRLINELIINKNISGEELLVGDRNAIMIQSRATAYGRNYDTSVDCPSCGAKAKHSFDLLEPKTHHGKITDSVSKLENGNYVITTPHSKVDVEVKMLTGKEESEMIKLFSDKNKKDDKMISSQMKLYIVSVKGTDNPKVIDYFIDNAPAFETRHIRNVYKDLAPDLRIVGDFECPSCGHEQELEVAFGADFFWPDR